MDMQDIKWEQHWFKNKELIQENFGIRKQQILEVRDLQVSIYIYLVKLNEAEMLNDENAENQYEWKRKLWNENSCCKQFKQLV